MNLINNPYREFYKRISLFSDEELLTVAIYDAALCSPEGNIFSMLANRIIDELISRDLPVSKTIRVRDKMMSLSFSSESVRAMIRRERDQELNRLVYQYRDIQQFSRKLNCYSSEGFLPELPENVIFLPAGYLWVNNELHIMGEDGATQCIYPGLIYIRRLLINRDDETAPQKAEVSFSCDGEQKVRTFDLSSLYDSSRLKALADNGAAINRNNAAAIAQYFFDYMSTFRSTMQRTWVTSHIGWQTKTTEDEATGEKKKQFCTFVPYCSEDEYDHYAFSSERRAILSSFGTVGEWAAAIRKYRNAEHIPFRIILAASFASVLAEPLMYQPFFVNIVGRSQYGKTPALMVVTSVWANPDEKLGYVKELSGSDDALEMGAQFYGNLPYCVNESQLRETGKSNIDHLVYQLGDGKPKTRAKGAGGLREQSNWCNAIFLTGEEILSQSSDKLGVRTRVLDLTLTEAVISPDDRETEALCERVSIHYNTAGREFVSHLLAAGGMDKARMLYNEYRERIPKNIERRQNHIAAAILTADRLAAEWIFEDSNYLETEDILPYLKRKPDEKQQQDYTPAQQLIDEWLRDQLGEDFQGKTDLGRVIKDTDIFVFFEDDTLLDLLRDNGYDPEKYISWAGENGRLAQGKDGSDKYPVSQLKNEPQHKSRLYAIRLPITP